VRGLNVFSDNPNIIVRLSEVQHYATAAPHL